MEGSPIDQAARSAVVGAARRLAAAGHNPGTAGNVSVRARGSAGGAFLVTPSGVVPDALSASDVVRVEADGSWPRSGPAPSSEWRLHADLYAARADVGAVVHAHSRYACAMACARRALPAHHYMVAALGDREVPCAPYATFGTEALSRAVVETLGARSACLLANHGQVAVGADLERALAAAELVEWLAELTWRVEALGGGVVLSGSAMGDVEDRFREGYGQPRSGPEG